MKKKLMLCVTLAFITTTLASCGFKEKTSEEESIPEDMSIELDSEYSCKLRLLIPQGNSN